MKLVKTMSYANLRAEEELAFSHQDVTKLLQMAEATCNKSLRNLCIAILNERSKKDR